MKKILFAVIAIFSFLFFSCNPVEKNQDSIYPRTGINDSLGKSGHIIETVKVLPLKEFKGNYLYQKNCKMCHGNEGKGDGVVARHRENICPYDLSNENRSDKDIYYIILEGKENMPSGKNKLDSNGAWILVIHIKKFKKD